MKWVGMKWVWVAFAAAMLCACGTATEAPSGGDGNATTNSDAGDTPLQAANKRVLVRPNSPDDMDDILEDVADFEGSVVKQIDGTNVFLVELPPDANIDEFIDELNGDARVIDSAKDRQVSSPEGGGATLPIGGDFDVFMIAPQAELVRIGANEARAKATGAGLRVAVIDSGVDPTHLALQGRIEPGGWDFVGNDGDPTDEANGQDDDGDGLVDEGWGHGTFVSSLILAMAPDASIRAYRVLDSDSNGIASQVAEAIIMATNDGVHVINLSLGMEDPVFVVREAIKYAKQNGVPVIASAGNTGQEDVTFPASISEAFAVASVDANDQKAQFSSFGDDIDLCAPGTRLIGAYPTAPDAAVMWPGTSFSAAVVTGLYCLVQELFPGESPPALQQMIEDASVDVDDLNPGYEGKIGEGRIDADAATSQEP